VTDWTAWHRGYDDPDSDLSRRRRSVQARIEEWLDAHPDGPLRVVSACAGDGTDLLEVLARRPDGGRVTARLLELDEGLAAGAEALARRHGLDGVEVLRRDAGRLSSYDGAVPADLVMWCGVFGNLDDTDVRATVRLTRRLAAPGAHVVWTRGRFDEDAAEPTDAIRAWFADEGFVELSLDAPRSIGYRVGAHRFAGEPAPLGPDETFFTFVR